MNYTDVNIPAQPNLSTTAGIISRNILDSIRRGQPLPALPSAWQNVGGPGWSGNTLNHIFGKPAHKLDPLVKKSGSIDDAWNAILDALRKLGTPNVPDGTVIDLIVNVNGHNVTVRGRMIDGIFYPSTAFIP